MAALNPPPEVEDVPDAIVDEEIKGFPVVWLLPLVALLVMSAPTFFRRGARR